MTAISKRRANARRARCKQLRGEITRLRALLKEAYSRLDADEADIELCEKILKELKP